MFEKSKEEKYRKAATETRNRLERLGLAASDTQDTDPQLPIETRDEVPYPDPVGDADAACPCSRVAGGHITCARATIKDAALLPALLLRGERGGRMRIVLVLFIFRCVMTWGLVRPCAHCPACAVTLSDEKHCAVTVSVTLTLTWPAQPARGLYRTV